MVPQCHDQPGCPERIAAGTLWRELGPWSHSAPQCHDQPGCPERFAAGSLRKELGPRSHCPPQCHDQPGCPERFAAGRLRKELGPRSHPAPQLHDPPGLSGPDHSRHNSKGTGTILFCNRLSSSILRGFCLGPAYGASGDYVRYVPWCFLAHSRASPCRSAAASTTGSL